jgi:hypothetical protein
VTCFDQPVRFELGVCRPQRVGVDADLGGELAQRGQAVAGAQDARFDRAAQRPGELDAHGNIALAVDSDADVLHEHTVRVLPGAAV